MERSLAESTYQLDKVFKELDGASSSARFLSSVVLVTTVVNLITLFFSSYILNTSIFEKLARSDLQSYSKVITLYAIATLLALIFELYAFHRQRREIFILISELQDEISWYDKSSDRSSDPIGIERRIKIRKASQNSALPFFEKGNDVFYYMAINILIFIGNASFVTIFAYQGRPLY